MKYLIVSTPEISCAVTKPMYGKLTTRNVLAHLRKNEYDPTGHNEVVYVYSFESREVQQGQWHDGISVLPDLTIDAEIFQSAIETGKIAVLVTCSLMTRAIVDVDGDYDSDVTAARKGFLEKVSTSELGENIESIDIDTECPFSEARDLLHI